MALKKWQQAIYKQQSFVKLELRTHTIIEIKGRVN